MTKRTDNQKQPHISYEEIEQRMQDRHAYMLYNEQYHEEHADEHRFRCSNQLSIRRLIEQGILAKFLFMSIPVCLEWYLPLKNKRQKRLLLISFDV